MRSVSTVQDIPPSEAIINAVAAHEDVDPLELEDPLFEVIDPEALDRLVQETSTKHSRSPLRIELTYHGYDVHVTSNGSTDVTVTDSSNDNSR